MSTPYTHPQAQFFISKLPCNAVLGVSKMRRKLEAEKQPELLQAEHSKTVLKSVPMQRTVPPTSVSVPRALEAPCKPPPMDALPLTRPVEEIMREVDATISAMKDAWSPSPPSGAPPPAAPSLDEEWDALLAEAAED
ncbi:hypothetical protein K488DRAFT_70006 [Vararia minispora EC-137]|uniref:Uncharacterized protein n=1 Tax=Vararia minispora EC-137 TaxID=1314806 RepID=A0ACB8QN01_9AGAM|nr:hypothetical protein K488DRAFT_70006 [Vararia minispora EC-137]